MKKFALIGNPNSGKTTLFNNLTGSTAHVGNWPGVTVDKLEGVYKKGNVNIVDLPGIYSLSPYTPEEVVSRNFILDEKPDCIINIIDATNLERNLYLTTQVMEIDVPIVIALNMMDMVEKNGDKLDIKLLEKNLGLKVVAISALKKENIDELMDVAIKESNKKRQAYSVLEESRIKDIVNNIKNAIDVDNPLFHAIKLIENDQVEINNHKNLIDKIDEYKKDFKDELFENDLEAVIADERYKYITKNYAIALKRKDESLGVETKSDKIDKILTNKFLGIPIFLVIMFLIFHFTFSENLFYLGGLFKDVSPSFEGKMFEGLFWTDAGINSPGMILFNFVDVLTSSFTDLVSGWLSNASPWASGLICDGILAGISGVLSFVPQILVLFLFFSILEDSGYMARVAFILDRIFKKFGLSGRAFMPMVMGFGCSVPAMINTRTLASENERCSTIRVIPFFSCGAKLPILTAIAGGISQVFGFGNVDLITYSMYVIGIVVAIISVILMRNTIMKGPVPPFIMELPNYHLPQASSLLIHLWDKLKHYLQKAFTIILVSTVVIWFLQSFTFDYKFIENVDVVSLTQEVYVSKFEDEEFKNLANSLEFTEETEFIEIYSLEEKTPEVDELINKVFESSYVEFKNVVTDPSYLDAGDSILAGIGKLVTPLFTPLGFGSNLDKETGWVYPVSAVTGLIAKENVIATFSVLAQTTQSANIDQLDNVGYIDLYDSVIDEDGVSSSVQMIHQTKADKNFAILISFIVFNMTTIPCFAAVATARGELTKKKFRGTLIFWVVASYLASTIIYSVLSVWWTSFIYIALGVLLGLGIKFYNKKKANLCD